MLPMTVGQKDTLTKSIVLKTTNRTIANFNFNRFIDTTVTNPMNVNPDNAYFPVTSVVLNGRPEAGIVKAMLSTSGYPVIGKVGGALTASDRDLWSYTTSLDDKYKYWRSPNFSTATLYLGAAGHYTLPNAQIQVLYGASADANKIVVGFENSYIQPKHVTIETRTGSTWTPSAFANPTLNSNGQLVLYRQANNTWGTTVYRDNPVTINGVRVTVNAVSAQNANAYVIEVAAAREVDMSSDISSLSADDSISEHSIVLPIGDVSSNEASVTLDNTTRRYAKRNTNSNLAPFMGKWGEVSVEFNIHKPTAAPVEGDYKRLFRRWVDIFRDDDHQATFELRDSSMLLQEAKPPAVTLTNQSVAAIAVYLCHSVGFRRVEYDIQDTDPQDTHAQIKYFWADPEKSVWEHLQELSEATQTAFYFDEDDVLQIKTRSAAFNLANSPVWVYDALDVSLADVTAQSRPAGDAGKFADLKEFKEESQQAPNSIEVKYVPTEAAKVIRDIPTMAVAWEPEETVVLRSSYIVTDIPLNNSTEHYIQIPAADSKVWPFIGMMQVDTEIIKYSGKQYSYYLADGTTTALKYVESVEEQKALDALNEGMAWRNVYTGMLRVKVGGRGFKNTVANTHLRKGRTYTSRIRTGAGSMVAGAKYVTKDFVRGVMRMNLTAYKPLASLTRLAAVTAGPLATAPRLYGTELKFPTSGYTTGAAGILIGAGTNDAGLYVEVCRSSVMGARTRNNEVYVTWKTSAGVETVYGKGAAVAIAAGVSYQLDVAVTSDASNHYVTVYIDGTQRLTVNLPKGATTATLSPNSGPFVRSSTICDFSYYYVYGGQVEDTGIDGSTYLDLIKGGYRSAIFRKILSAPSTPTSRLPISSTYTRSGVLESTIIDEFGTVAHEVRDFDVDYSVLPALSSTLYISNPQVAATDFVPTPTSAKFTLVNVTRTTAVINGEDTLTYGADNSVDQKLLVYGRMVTREEAKSKNSKNDAAIIRSGISELAVESDWIQTEEQANRIGQWIMATNDASEGELSGFANPYIQLLDMVGIQDAENGRAWATDRHFVISRKVTLNKGLTVDLTTRRAV